MSFWAAGDERAHEGRDRTDGGDHGEGVDRHGVDRGRRPTSEDRRERRGKRRRRPSSPAWMRAEYGRRSLHGVGQPDVERELAGFTDGAAEDEEPDGGREGEAAGEDWPASEATVAASRTPWPLS